MKSFWIKHIITVIAFAPLCCYGQDSDSTHVKPDTTHVRLKIDIDKIKVDTTFDYSKVKYLSVKKDSILYLINNKRFQNAIASLLYELNINPVNADALALIGVILGDVGKDSAAIKCYDKAIEMMPRETQFHFNRGVAYENLKQYRKAIDDYSIVIAYKPKHRKAYFNRGYCYEKLKIYGNAIDDYDMDLKIKGETAETYNNRGLCYLFTERYKKALSDFNKALELEPNFARAYTNRGLYFVHEKDYDNACKDFKRASELGLDQHGPIDKFCNGILTPKH